MNTNLHDGRVPHAPEPLDTIAALEGYFADSTVPQRIIRFDFDSPEGAAFITRLTLVSDAYLGRDRELGPEEPFQDWVHNLPEEAGLLERAERSAAAGDPRELHELWHDYFDYEFSLASATPREHVVLHCVDALDKEERGLRQSYLLSAYEYAALDLPSEWRYSIN